MFYPISWPIILTKTQIGRSSPSEVFLGIGALKISSKFTGEHPCWSVISLKLPCNFIENTFWQGCSPVNLLHVFRTPSVFWILDAGKLSNYAKCKFILNFCRRDKIAYLVFKRICSCINRQVYLLYITVNR